MTASTNHSGSHSAVAVLSSSQHPCKFTVFPPNVHSVSRSSLLVSNLQTTTATMPGRERRAAGGKEWGHDANGKNILKQGLCNGTKDNIGRNVYYPPLYIHICMTNLLLHVTNEDGHLNCYIPFSI